MILIITSRKDTHVQAVSRHLDEARESWVRINTEDFATNIDIEIEPASGTGHLRVKDSGRTFRLEDVGAVWYRKPEPVSVDHFDMDPNALTYVEAEFNEVILGLYTLLDHAYWINNPFTTRAAHRKPLQLKTAARVGFRIPETVITNQSDSAISFCQKIDGDMAIKSLGAISVIENQPEHTRQYGIFTRRIDSNDLKAFSDKIRYMPTLFQRFVRKKAELRITCVDERVFACRIETRPNDITSDDYRFDTANLQHTKAECPGLTARLRSYMKELNINFGCFDFIVTEDDDYIFLECNCNGQWLWVENLTHLPIGYSIANLLMLQASYRSKFGAPSMRRGLA